MNSALQREEKPEGGAGERTSQKSDFSFLLGKQTKGLRTEPSKGNLQALSREILKPPVGEVYW